MGMPEQPQSGMNIAPDGTVYEILDDGTIKRIGKVSPDGSFEPFGGTKDGIREKNGIIYRVINGKEVKIGRILPNGEIETINQRIKSETEIARSKVKIVTIVSVCCLIAFLAILYSFNSQQQAKVKTAEIDARIRREELASQERRAEEERKKKEAETKKAEEERKRKEAEAKKAEAKKAEEDRKKKEAEAKKAEAERKRTKTEPLTELSEEDERALERIIERNIPHLQKKEAEEERKRKEAETKKAEEEQRKKNAKIAATKSSQKIGNLEWSNRSPKEMHWWGEPNNYCKSLTEGGHNDWRLPNINELRRLVKNHPGTVSGGTCKFSNDKCWEGSDCEGRKGKNFSKLGDTVDLCAAASCELDPVAGGVLISFSDGGIYGAYFDRKCYVRCVRNY